MTPAAAPLAPTPKPYAAALAAGLVRLGQSLAAPRVRLRDFFPPAWTIVNPGIPYIPNWHNDLIAEHLEAVHLGQIKLLDIEMPPRFGKSFHVTVAFPCWEWTEDPSERYLFSSYNQKLCTRHSLDRRAIIQSAWYRNLWGEFVQLADDQNLKTEFQNKARGHMITAPFGSSGTGSGGRRLVIDDPINPKQAASKVQREAALEYYKGTLTTRLDDEANSAIIIVAQRTSVDDIQGKVVSEADGWVRLKIPIQAKHRTTYIFPLSKKEKVYEVGELLCPSRKSARGVQALRKMMGRAAAAQLDQEPEMSEGNIFPRHLWKPLAEEPEALFVLTFWDTAVKEKEESDYSAGVTVIKHAKGYHFCRGLTKGQWRFSDLKLAARHKYQTDLPNAIGIEDKSSGQQLLQEFQDDSDLPVITFDMNDQQWKDWVRMDKVARASLVQPLWAAGRVSYDPHMEGAAQLLEDFAAFPNAGRDTVDAGVHAVRYLQQLDRQAAPEESGDFAEAAMDDGI